MSPLRFQFFLGWTWAFASPEGRATTPRILLPLLVLGLACAASAQNRQLAASDPAPRQIQATPSESVAAQTGELRRRADNAERDSAIAEAKTELQEQAYSRLEILLAVLVGFFGSLITGVVIFFAVRTKSEAISEAIAAAVPAAKEGVKDLREQFALQVNEGKAEIEALRGHSAEARKMFAEAKQIISGLKAEETPSDPAEREKVETAAQAANQMPPAERTADDLKSLIVAGHIANDWASVRDHARALLYLHGNFDESAEAYGKFHLAYSLGRLNQRAEAIEIYKELISQFRNNPDHQEEISNSFVNLSSSYCILGYYQKAIKAAEQGIAYIRDNKNESIRIALGYLYYNKACAHARMGNAKDAVHALTERKSLTNTIDCNEILNESDFDAVRDDPHFVRFWRESGCAGDEATPDKGS